MCGGEVGLCALRVELDDTGCDVLLCKCCMDGERLRYPYSENVCLIMRFLCLPPYITCVDTQLVWHVDHRQIAICSHGPDTFRSSTSKSPQIEILIFSPSSAVTHIYPSSRCIVVHVSKSPQCQNFNSFPLTLAHPASSACTTSSGSGPLSSAAKFSSRCLTLLAPTIIASPSSCLSCEWCSSQRRAHSDSVRPCFCATGRRMSSASK
jgi:hypothetical protein